MGNNRIASVYDTGVITTFVEHTHIKVQHVGKIHGASCCSFIRADGHHVLAVDLKIFYMSQKSLYKLISRADSFKSA